MMRNFRLLTSFEEDKYFMKTDSKYYDIIESIQDLPFLTTEEKFICTVAPCDFRPNKKFLNSTTKNMLHYFRDYIK